MSRSPSERTQVHRHPERGVYDRALIHRILDEALICHVAWVDPDGGPRVLPTIHARIGDTLYIHGSRAGRPWRTLLDGAEICIAATIVDGLVLARSAFSHSMNYRSAVVYGRAHAVTEPEELDRAARAITSHVAPGREGDARMPTEGEYRQTLLLSVPLDEVSAKVRSGPPIDGVDDLRLPIWAGVLPIGLAHGVPEPAPDLDEELTVPEYVTGYRRPT